MQDVLYLLAFHNMLSACCVFIQTKDFFYSDLVFNYFTNAIPNHISKQTNDEGGGKLCLLVIHKAS